jgi:hypothetical protein
MTIEQCIEMQKTLPKDKEGFVIEFESGLRVKIKGDEYMKIAKIMSCMTPLAFWEVMVEGKVPQEYLAQIPEELRPQWEPIVNLLESSYANALLDTIVNIDIIKQIVGIEDFRAVGIFLKEHAYKLKHPELVWPSLRKNDKALDKSIMSIIRPKGNVL